MTHSQPSRAAQRRTNATIETDRARRRAVRAARSLLVLMIVLLLTLAAFPVGDIRQSWFVWAAALPVLAALSTNSDRVPAWVYTWTGARFLFAGTLLLGALLFALAKWFSW